MEATLLLQLILNRLAEIGREEWHRFVDEEGEAFLDHDAILHECLERFFPNGDADNEELAGILVQLPIIQKAFDELATDVKEGMEESERWMKANNRGIHGLLEYFGMSTKDFV